MRLNSFSLALNLKKIINNKHIEEQFIKKIKLCKKEVGKQFNLFLYYDDLKEYQIKKFVQKHQDLLFLLHTKITKKTEYTHTWFIIDDYLLSREYKFSWRFFYVGDFESGLDKYIEMVRHVANK